MGDLITRLGNLFNLSKAFALTVPGVVAASALAILLWPPYTVDTIMRPTRMFTVVNDVVTPCEFGSPTELVKPQKTTPAAINEAAHANQRTLELARAELRACISGEGSADGKEEEQIKNLETQIKVFEKNRDELQLQYLRYEKADSRLAGEFRAKYGDAGKDINDLRALITKQQSRLASRKLSIQLETDYLKVVEERLADPGRPGHGQSVNDFLSRLTDHIVAFTLLALAFGFMLDPINRAIFGGLFDGVLIRAMNKLYTNRFTVWR